MRLKKNNSTIIILCVAIIFIIVFILFYFKKTNEHFVDGQEICPPGTKFTNLDSKYGGCVGLTTPF
jgi:hypothetical protein